MENSTKARKSVAFSIVAMFLALSAAFVLIPLFLFPHELNIIPFIAYFPAAGLSSVALYKWAGKHDKSLI